MIVFELPDGSIRYATCAAKMKRPGEITSEWLLRVFNKTVRDNYPGAKRMLNPVMPNGEVFRPGARKLFYEAWRHAGGGNIEIDMPMAREIQLGKIRAERNRLLDESDRERARLDDVGTAPQKTAIAAYRQALRDLPTAIDLDAIMTPEALLAFEPLWPVAP